MRVAFTLRATTPKIYSQSYKLVKKLISILLGYLTTYLKSACLKTFRNFDKICENNFVRETRTQVSRAAIVCQFEGYARTVLDVH